MGEGWKFTGDLRIEGLEVVILKVMDGQMNR